MEVLSRKAHLKMIEVLYDSPWLLRALSLKAFPSCTGRGFVAISSTSQGQEIHRLPVPRSVKADWDRLNTADSNSIAEAKRLGMQIKNRYKKMLPPESSDHDVFKLRMSRVCLADEFNEMDENLKCPKP
ncbi:hypothetical protein Q3G72_028899 [Acer saccharum]|nr:hypothetical protein Q3G72_026738 [Acer saccharum]KAK1557656.1 hypothetical protein Q3G72_028899 [Acer saccharum]